MALFVFSWLIAPGSVSGSAIDSLLPFAGILAIAAIGQTIVVMLKGIDLSLPGMMTLAALVSSKYAADHGSILAALVVVAVLAVVVGVVNGVVVSVFSVTPLVATLAVNAILMGAALAYSGGTPTRAPQSVSDFALEKTLGVSNTVWLAVALMIVTVFATGRAAWGRRHRRRRLDRTHRPRRRCPHRPGQDQRLRRRRVVLQRRRCAARRLRQHPEHQRGHRLSAAGHRRGRRRRHRAVRRARQHRRHRRGGVVPEPADPAGAVPRRALLHPVPRPGRRHRRRGRCAATRPAHRDEPAASPKGHPRDPQPRPAAVRQRSR